MKGRVRTYKQSVVNAVVLVAVVFLFVYVAYQIFGGFSSKVSTQRTQTFTESEYAYFEGYIFRNESVITVDGNGIVDRLVPNGERLGVGKHFADFYPSGATEEQIEASQNKLDMLNSGIDLLYSQINDGNYVSDLAHISEDLVKYYYAYSEAITDGDISSADRYGEEFLNAIVAYRVVTGRDGEAENVGLELENEKKELLASIGVQPDEMVADEGCHYFYNSDGYENIFSTDKLDGLTSAYLDRLISSEPETVEKKVIGRLVHDPKWYVCIPCSDADVLKFAVGKSYDALFSDGEVAISMLLERAVTDEGGSYLLFSSLDMSESYEFSRSQSVRILTDSTTGYRVPSQAMCELNGESGVYVLVGSVAEFRRATVIGEGNGYYIVNTNERDAAEGVNSETPYLSVNDLIITSGNDLYDGKHFDK